ncbi:hypothetical protein [Paraburkholderia xenovorans]|uniref:hypothetical protein n=1 Tax=Paraburkholderia xenovorans TaxID=36873 RepID=UPI0038BE1184
MLADGVASSNVPETGQLLNVPLSVPSLAIVSDEPVSAHVPATLDYVTASAFAAS